MFKYPDYKDEDILYISKMPNADANEQIPKLKIVGPYAFSKTTRKVVELPETYVIVGMGAFSTSKIEVFVGNEGLEMIDNYAFSDCFYLKKAILPTTLKRIGDKTFSNCYGLEKLDLPSGLTDMHINALRDCANLKYIACGEDLALKIYNNYEMLPSLKGLYVKDNDNKIIGQIKINRYSKVYVDYKNCFYKNEKDIEIKA